MEQASRDLKTGGYSRAGTAIAEKCPSEDPAANQDTEQLRVSPQDQQLIFPRLRLTGLARIRAGTLTTSNTGMMNVKSP